MIVGFPTETEDAFHRTLDAVDAADITKVHTFSYSPRPGTEAEELGDRIHPRRRSAAHRPFVAAPRCGPDTTGTAKLGQNECVLVDKTADTQCSGYTADYTRCYLPPAAAARGQLVDVRCDELHADGIRCGAILKV